MVSLGMTNTAIARKLRRGETAIKNSLIRDFTLLGITPRRRGIARAFFDRGIYQIEEFGDSLDLTASEFQIIDNLSQGKTDKEAAENITESTDKKISETTIRNHLTHIGKRTGWHGMEATLAAIVSGDVGNYALRGEVEDPSVAAQEVPIPATRKPLSFMEYESGTI
jgi:DNA-binding NarL/FixJ family response regulator